MCPLFRGSTVHKEEDNLSIVDKMAGPNVSFIQRVPEVYIWDTIRPSLEVEYLCCAIDNNHYCLLYSECPTLLEVD